MLNASAAGVSHLEQTVNVWCFSSVVLNKLKTDKLMVILLSVAEEVHSICFSFMSTNSCHRPHFGDGGVAGQDHYSPAFITYSSP